ncbi:MAG: ABC transporter ATP-binding protein [Candidatus Methylacidiphilales bacterium]|nr:ABC transporter ATP-binding protein [Candidatus Methylacidiphilales bacterium]
MDPTPLPPIPAVRVEKLTKIYPLHWRRGNLLALEDLDLDIRQGEIFGLLGPNGSGKSTTMKLLLGLARPSRGAATVFGHRAGSMAARRRLGFLPENPYFPQFLSGREVLAYYGRLCGMGGDPLRGRIAELIELVGLGQAGERRLRTYSKGMLQRIGLAQALLHDPDLLLLDEPTAGVDPVGSREIRDLMLLLKRRGKTVIFSSHLLEQVEEVADRVAILHQGRKLREGRLDELLVVPEETTLRVRGLRPETQARVLELLRQEGHPEVSVSRPRMSLEDFFIRVLPGKDQEPV